MGGAGVNQKPSPWQSVYCAQPVELCESCLLLLWAEVLGVVKFLKYSKSKVITIDQELSDSHNWLSVLSVAGVLRLWCQGGCGGRPRPHSVPWLPLQLLLGDALCLAVHCARWLPAHSGDIWLWCVWKPWLCSTVLSCQLFWRGRGRWRDDFHPWQLGGRWNFTGS